MIVCGRGGEARQRRLNGAEGLLRWLTLVSGSHSCVLDLDRAVARDAALTPLLCLVPGVSVVGAGPFLAKLP